jgi:predicted ArsR family transcriptional regulator
MEHGEFCQTELELYRRLLGVPIVREERIAAGGDCCRYRIDATGTPNAG